MRRQSVVGVVIATQTDDDQPISRSNFDETSHRVTSDHVTHDNGEVDVEEQVAVRTTELNRNNEHIANSLPPVDEQTRNVQPGLVKYTVHIRYTCSFSLIGMLGILRW